jgi:formyl-CoA transferase
VREATGSDELMSKAWADPVYRVQHREDVDTAIAHLCAALPRSELVRRGQELGLLVLPVNTVVDIANDPHLTARGFVTDVQHSALGRSLRLMRSPFRSSAYETEVRPAPALGADTVEVLRDMAGLTEGEIERLRSSGLIATRQDAEVSVGGS